MDDVIAAKVLIQCLDLTSLGNDDTDFQIEKLCSKASTSYGKVAAVCVFPKFVPLAKTLLKNNNIKVATVVNFPDGSDNLIRVEREIDNALMIGADEIDAVFPYRNFLNGDYKTCEDFVKLVVSKCDKKHICKIILETGELKSSTKIIEATQICIENGANFIKTSTGKTETSATPEAANCILETILASHKNVGFKASGGIKTIDDAKKYLILANTIMGSKWISPKNLRIGASSLIDNLLEVIKRGY